MSVYKVSPLDFSGVRTIPFSSRESKVGSASFAKRIDRSGVSILDSMPNILAAADLVQLAERIVRAGRLRKNVLWGLGAHVLKVGLSPILIQLLEEGFISGIALNGAGIVHDFEIATRGETSEDVDGSLRDGTFGVTQETGEVLNAAITKGAAEGLGIGESVGRTIAEMATPTAGLSLLGTCYKLRIPVTVHVAIGTDVIHIHPSADGAAIGASSFRDFRLFAALVAGLTGGGVYINLGSAVLLPEVFLKAVSVVRNLGMPLTEFTTANLDFLNHYRPLTNVVRRPVAGHGQGFSITGHHEILVPVLALALLEARERSLASEANATP